MTVSSRRSARSHEPLIAGLTPDERAALAADLLAANLMETIEAVLTKAAPEIADVSTALPAAPHGNFPPVMGPDQAAAYCAIGVNRMRDLLRAGAIQGRRSGRRWLVRREALDEWMRAEEAEQQRRVSPSQSRDERRSGMLGSSLG
jgi:excisionase family DNA binding protein